MSAAMPADGFRHSSWRDGALMRRPMELDSGRRGLGRSERMRPADHAIADRWQLCSSAADFEPLWRVIFRTDSSTIAKDAMMGSGISRTRTRLVQAMIMAATMRRRYALEPLRRQGPRQNDGADRHDLDFHIAVAQAMMMEISAITQVVIIAAIHHYVIVVVIAVIIIVSVYIELQVEPAIRRATAADCPDEQD